MVSRGNVTLTLAKKVDLIRNHKPNDSQQELCNNIKAGLKDTSEELEKENEDIPILENPTNSEILVALNIIRRRTVFTQLNSGSLNIL